MRQEKVVDAFLDRLQKNPSATLVHLFTNVAIGNEKAANALVGLIENAELEQYSLWSLGQIGVRNENVLNVSLQSFQA